MLSLAHALGGLQRHRPASQRWEEDQIPHPSLAFHDAHRYGKLLLDGPFYLLWPCLILWLPFEADMGYAWLHEISGK